MCAACGKQRSKGFAWKSSFLSFQRVQCSNLGLTYASSACQLAWDFETSDALMWMHQVTSSVQLSPQSEEKLIWFHYTRCMLIHLDSCYSHVFVDYLWKIWCKIQSALQRYRALKDWCLQCTKATLLRCWNDAWHGSAQRTAMAKNGLFFDMSRSTWKCFLGQEFAAPEKNSSNSKWEKLETRQTEATLRLRLNKSYPLDGLYVWELELNLHHPVLLSWESSKDIETARLLGSFMFFLSAGSLESFQLLKLRVILGQKYPLAQSGLQPESGSKHWKTTAAHDFTENDLESLTWSFTTLARDAFSSPWNIQKFCWDGTDIDQWSTWIDVSIQFTCPPFEHFLFLSQVSHALSACEAAWDKLKHYRK